MAPLWKDRRSLARALIATALRAADPAAALRQHWVPHARTGGRRVLLSVGKASVPMLREAISLLDGRYDAAILTTLPEHAGTRFRGAHIFPCDHPFPTARNVAAARVIRAELGSLGPQDDLIILLSGGASAHLSLPCPGLTLRHIAQATRLLQRAGATIAELNTVRKHCEQLKGGQLVADLPCPVRAFILSDVIGDPLDVIGSGPTAPDPTTHADALAVLAKHRLLRPLPALTTHLRRGVRSDIPDTPKPGDPRFTRVTNTIIASNAKVVTAVATHLLRAGFRTRAVTGITGESAEVAREFVQGALADAPPGAWVVGGETTVTVGRAKGLGGPSQEFALAGALALAGQERTALITFSTDGRDGPTDAAGGFVTGDSTARIARSGIDPAQALRSHDSRAALAAANGLIRVRPTGTNLNHVAVLLRYAR